jgi:hypothetical protein
MHRNADKAAPIACTLSMADFRSRAQWLNGLTARSLISHRQDGLIVHLIYKADAIEDVEKLVRQEQRCCGFLKFDLNRGPESVELTITAPPSAGDDARALYAQLVPAEAQPAQ